MQNFRRLRAWHLAKDLAVDVAKLLPSHACRRIPGFHSQVLRAVVSISANIAEGCGKSSRPELRRYLETSLGSLLEVHSDLEIALGCSMIRSRDYAVLAGKLTVLRRMLASLIRRLDAAGTAG